MSNPRRLLSPDELKDLKGIRFSRQHLHRLIKAGRFPKPVKLGESTNGWVESEIDQYIEDLIAERDAAAKAA
jgi:prophage regulatory protein